MLRVKGIDPARSAGRLATLVEQEIKNLKEQGDEIPAKLRALHASLRKEVRAMGPLPEARETIRSLFSVVASPKADSTVQVYGRRVKKLTDADKKILDELAAELLKENEETESFDQ